MGIRKTLALVVAGVMLVVVLVLSGKVVENVDANEILVIQDWYDGDLHWYTSAGVKLQLFGRVTAYPKRAIYDFKCDEYKEGTSESQCAEGTTDGRISIRFNDGGHGWVDGSIQYEMPLNDANLTELHVRFGSRESIQKQLIETVVNKSVYMTGPLMSSRESFADKRNDLLRYVEDQVEGGVYQTTARDVRVKDELSGTDKTVKLVEIVNGQGGQPLRQEEAQLTKFGLKPFNFSIKRLPYDTEVELQIKQQQQITMQVQTAIAESRQAEQRAITVEQQGKADAAKAKWDQEVIKAKFVTEAQQRLEIAELDRKAAIETKAKDILLGEGEARRRELVMSADGALDKKLATWIEGQKLWSDAVKGYAGNWVPSVVMGGGQNGATASGAQDLVNLLTAKTARELGLDLSISRSSGKQ
ncbi:MAG: cell envelope integrity protein TolA [Candidatus Taylorbacteria bacterium]|nr:cell envelope integrity protein TolA [Candidatus Taylorbacteria bacterium]